MQKPLSPVRFLAVRLGIYLSAVAIAYILATFTATQAVVSRLAAMGVNVSLADQAAMSFRDIAGMAPMFLPLVAFALLIAFLCAALLSHVLSRHFGRISLRWRTAVYVVAGATALVMIHVTLKLAFGLAPIAVARTAGGLALQAMAGGIGGFTYAFLVRRWPLRPGLPARPAR